MNDETPSKSSKARSLIQRSLFTVYYQLITSLRRTRQALTHTHLHPSHQQRLKLPLLKPRCVRPCSTFPLQITYLELIANQVWEIDFEADLAVNQNIHFNVI